MRSLPVLAFSALLGGTILGTPALADSKAEPATADAASLTLSVDGGLRDAQAKRLSGDLAGAVRVLSQLMLINADDGRVVAEYGKVLVQQGRTREALDFLKRAVELTQNDWTLYSALGVAYDGGGDYANAKAAYDHALQMKPGEPAILNNYALSRAMAGDLPQAKLLIAQAATASNDERVARNVKMINALTPPARVAAQPAAAKSASKTPSPKAAVATPQSASAAASSPPRMLTSAEGKQIVMQAVPYDPKAGTVTKPRSTAKTTPTKVAKKSDGIPALRLANDRQ